MMDYHKIIWITLMIDVKDEDSVIDKHIMSDQGIMVMNDRHRIIVNHDNMLTER